MLNTTIAATRPALDFSMPSREACDPSVAVHNGHLTVTMYGRPYEITEEEARQLAQMLVSTLEEMRVRSLS